jgi:hypothetical protein
MRPALLLFLASILLAACLSAPERAVGSPEDGTTSAAPLTDPVSLAETEIEPGAGGAEDATAAPSALDNTRSVATAPAMQSAPPPLPPALAAEARACAQSGGTLRPRGMAGLYSCVRATRDAGRACSSGSDCEGECLARSRTCAPLDPLFGCHEVLDRAGRTQTLCRQ